MTHDLHEEVRQHAVLLGCSHSELMRQAIAVGLPLIRQRWKGPKNPWYLERLPGQVSPRRRARETQQTFAFWVSDLLHRRAAPLYEERDRRLAAEAAAKAQPVQPGRSISEASAS